MILFNPKFGFQTASIVTDKNGRSLIVRVTVHDSTFVLCNVYTPNDNSKTNKKFFANLNNALRFLLRGGNFNCALTAPDKIGGNSVDTKKKKKKKTSMPIGLLVNF